MPVTTARRRVLAYLQKQHAVSASQIGRALEMSAADVRHHLSMLSADGRVVKVGETRKGGRGRPVKLYGLSENLRGNNLAWLSDALLDQLMDGLSPEQQGEKMRVIAKALADSMSLGDLSSLALGKKLATLVEKLNGIHYQSRWEAGAEGPRILFAHCPYSAIIQKHPELCRMDAAMLEELMGQPAAQSAKIGQGGSQLCVFAMGAIKR